MTEEQLSNTRSIRVFYIALAVIFALFVWRLFDLQVVNSERYRQLALEEHLKKFEIAPTRGTISLSDGEGSSPLVLNEVRPTLFADPTGIEDPRQVALQLTDLVAGEPEDYEELLGLEETAYVVLKKQLTAKQAENIREADIPGIGLQDVTYRVYPEDTLAAQIVGFVNDEGEGQYGVEAALQEELEGKSGQLKAITDINGIPLTASDDTVEVPAENGADVVLTIDRSIQSEVEALLEQGVKDAKADTGSAIVMDPDTGAILAMANYPTYNPARYTEVELEDYESFNNRVVSNAYETGSGVKVFTMATGLNEGVVTKDSEYFDSGAEKVADRVITNADGSGNVTRTMTEVIQKSVNTGVVHVAKMLGGGEINDDSRNTIYDYFTNKFGFGSATGIAQTSESAGTIISPDEQEGNEVRYANMTFGQGMTVTMLQMVSAFSAVVNGGDYYQPHLIKSVDDVATEPQITRGGIVTPATSKAIVEMTQTVVQNGGGYTAKRDGYFIGGKTGTAQVLNDDGTYSDDREVGSFIGYTGGERAEYVIMTRVDEPGIPGYAGSVAAAPIFADISNFLIDHYQIPPGN